MKKTIFILCLTTICFFASGQEYNIVNASIALRQENLADAKKYIDEAYATESTSNDPKMWNYRAPIYLQIAQKEAQLDIDAALKAAQAYLKCMEKDEKGRIIVRKWTSIEDVLSGLIQSAYLLFNGAIDQYNQGNYARSLKLYAAIFDVIPFDEEAQLKRGNITKETILLNSYFSAKKMNDNTLCKDYLQQLIDANFNEPSIYIYMSNIYLDEKNYEKAIEYLALGREMFSDNKDLINTEINLFIQLGRTKELIEKLSTAIELDPENEVLYFNRGTVYDQNGNTELAENDYLHALEINPNSFSTNYNLGALYFNFAVKLNTDAGNTENEKKYKSLRDQASKKFDQALPFLEKAHQLDKKDKNTLLSLKQLYAQKGEYDKSKVFQQKLEDLK